MNYVRHQISKVTMLMISIINLKTHLTICKIVESRIIEKFYQKSVLDTMKMILLPKINTVSQAFNKYIFSRMKT
jgi:hypothetical protein